MDLNKWWRGALILWYAYYLALAPFFACIKAWFSKICDISPLFVYYPDTDKRFLITPEINTMVDKALLNDD